MKDEEARKRAKESEVLEEIEIDLWP